MRRIAALAIPLALVAVAGCAAAGPAATPPASPTPAPTSTPAPTAAADVGPAQWWVDPAELPLDPAAMVIKALLVERKCASGKPPDGRILPPAIEYGEDEIIVTFEVTRPEGDQDCQGNPEFPVEIELSEPLGDRTLVDGFDGRDATEPPA